MLPTAPGGRSRGQEAAPVTGRPFLVFRWQPQMAAVMTEVSRVGAGQGKVVGIGEMSYARMRRRSTASLATSFVSSG